MLDPRRGKRLLSEMHQSPKGMLWVAAFLLAVAYVSILLASR
jgi:hypothetical protein